MRLVYTAIFAFAVLCASPASGQIGVIKVLSLDQTTPHLFQGIITQPPLHDIDRDGIPEIVIDGSGFFAEISGLKTNWEFDDSTAGLINPRFLGFFRMTTTTGPATHAAFIDEAGFYLAMLNNKNPDLTRYEVVNGQNARFFTMRRLASGHEVAVIGNDEGLHVLGETTRFRGGEVALSKTGRAIAYDLVEKYSGSEGEQLGYDPGLYPFDGQSDVNDDGIDDLLFLRWDQNGIPVGVVLLSGDSFDEIWRWDFPLAYLERVMMGFHGFADVDGDGMKELFCGDNLVVSRDGSVQELREQFRIQHLLDVDGDGLLDVIGTDQLADRLLVLGKATSTSVRALPLPTLVHFHPSYPNPVTGSSTFSFTVQTTTPVSINLYDALGRRVRTLVHSTFESGRHTVAWEAADETGASLPAGAYSAILTAGGETLRQSIIIAR